MVSAKVPSAPESTCNRALENIISTDQHGTSEPPKFFKDTQNRVITRCAFKFSRQSHSYFPMTVADQHHTEFSYHPDRCIHNGLQPKIAQP